MPNYETPGPISATVDLGAGDARIAASDRTVTVVEVRPSDEADESDVKAAQQVLLVAAGPYYLRSAAGRPTRQRPAQEAQ